MKVKLLKDHLGDKKGKTLEVTAERANYFKRCGIAKIVNETTPQQEKPATNEPSPK